MTWVFVGLVVVGVALIAFEATLRKRGGGADGRDPGSAVFSRHPVLTIIVFVLVLGLIAYARSNRYN